MKRPLIDAHVHCGRQVKTDPVTGEDQPQDLIDYLAWAKGSGIVGAVMFSPVPEVYDRLDPNFVDDAHWQARRRDSNSYLLSLDPSGFEIFPYFFIWNDFAVDHLSPRHQGIKWHRHSDEPRYEYDDPRCAAAIAEIRRRDLTVCLEEEWEYTWRFMTELAPGVRVVIPHCGRLNGGYERFCAEGLWGQPNVWTDISNASTEWVMDYLARYGSERIMFASDFPFAPASAELVARLEGLEVTEAVREAIGFRNVRRLLAEAGRG